MTSIKDQLFQEVCAEKTNGSSNKVSIVGKNSIVLIDFHFHFLIYLFTLSYKGIGAVGMAAAFSILTQVCNDFYLLQCISYLYHEISPECIQ